MGIKPTVSRLGRSVIGSPRVRFWTALIVGFGLGLLFLPPQVSVIHDLRRQVAAVRTDVQRRDATIAALGEQIKGLQGDILSRDKTIQTLTRKLQAHRVVPAVVGASLTTVEPVFRDEYLWHVKTKGVVSTAAHGTIISTAPPAGTWMHLSETITLTWAKWRYPPVNGNPWDYNWVCCHLIYNPVPDFCGLYFGCILNFPYGMGYVVQCHDGLFSKSGGRPGGVCSAGHGGPSRPLFSP